MDPHTAVGRGSFWWNCQIITGTTCAPLIAPMTVTLSGARTCPDGRRTFARAVFSAKGIARRSVMSYDCQGRSRAEGTAPGA
jgi:hypothetical protein